MNLVDIISSESPVSLTDGQLSEMNEIYRELTAANAVMNLTALKTETETAELHFVDSLYPLATRYVSGSVLDVGSGGGFPAFPIAIASGLEVTCLDATQKKLDFISSAAASADIRNISVLCGRAEELGARKPYRAGFDTVLARGVAKLNVLCEWCMPFLKTGGYFIALKGATAEAEATEAENAVKLLGGRVVDIIHYSLKLTAHNHALVVIEKTAPTPELYPRRNSMIMKKPL